jgi:tetratricopeptide (TPR) repeat protein
MNRLSDQVRVALAIADDPSVDATERAEMLMEIASALQHQPQSAAHLCSAIELYDRALAVCPAAGRLVWARITARRATALQALPGDDLAPLVMARDAYQQAIPLLLELGIAEEVAEAEMNHGLVLQTLAAGHQARITDAIAAYQRALRTFDRARFPREVAIIHNNLATAFLSIPLTDERSQLREALAVQAFEDALEIVSLVDYPVEYAMLQNNLGNALQYASSSHAVENNLRALDAYDEALRVRTPETMPVAYANTIANKANCLWNLPDDALDAAPGHRLRQAHAYYREAREIFADHGELDRARIVGDSCDELELELVGYAEPSAGVEGSP